ncbi:MAG: hypothetical protein Q9201_001051 [Fulgogasparrea decipioides]
MDVKPVLEITISDVKCPNCREANGQQACSITAQPRSATRPPSNATACPSCKVLIETKLVQLQTQYQGYKQDLRLLDDYFMPIPMGIEKEIVENTAALKKQLLALRRMISRVPARASM